MIRRLRLIIAMVLAGVVGALGWLAWVEDVSFISAADAKPPAKAAPAPTLSPQHLYLIRATLGALQDANTTGNYSVLRDLSAPSFQAKHSAADLAELFSAARRRPIDLAPATYTQPVITEMARPDPAHLSLIGYIPTAVERLTFTLQFEAVGGHWRLAGVALAATPLNP